MRPRLSPRVDRMGTGGKPEGRETGHEDKASQHSQNGPGPTHQDAGTGTDTSPKPKSQESYQGGPYA